MTKRMTAEQRAGSICDDYNSSPHSMRVVIEQGIKVSRTTGFDLEFLAIDADLVGVEPLYVVRIGFLIAIGKILGLHLCGRQ